MYQILRYDHFFGSRHNEMTSFGYDFYFYDSGCCIPSEAWGIQQKRIALGSRKPPLPSFWIRVFWIPRLIDFWLASHYFISLCTYITLGTVER